MRFYGFLHKSSITVTILGCLPFNQNSRKFRLESKRNSYFLEKPFGNCGIRFRVVLLFRLVQTVAKFCTICSFLPFSLSGISSAKVSPFSGFPCILIWVPYMLIWVPYILIWIPCIPVRIPCILILVPAEIILFHLKNFGNNTGANCSAKSTNRAYLMTGN